VLLEVVVSLSILLVAMSVVGLTVRNIQRNIERGELIARGDVMTERLVAEMDTGILDSEERDQSGWFGVEAPEGMSWRVEINPHDTIERLVEVDVRIYLGDPDGDEDERRLVSATRLWRVEPRGLDLERDFGLDEDQIDQLTEAIPGGVAVLDPNDFDPRSLAHLDMEMLSELLPTLIQAFGGSFMGGDLNSLLKAVETGDLGALEGAVQQFGGSIGGVPGLPGGRQGAGGPDRPGRGERRGQSGGERPERGERPTRQGIGQRGGGGNP
jgi:hypothetical protein